jgi:hypothetical protein
MLSDVRVGEVNRIQADQTPRLPLNFIAEVN